MLEEFYDRINLKSELSDLSKVICAIYIRKINPSRI